MPEGTGSPPPAPGLERVKFQPSDSVSDWASSHKPGSRLELHSSDIQEDYVDVDEFDNDIDTSNAPKQSDHGEGDRPETPSYAAAVAAHNRTLKRSGHATGQANVQSSRYVSGSTRTDLPDAYHEQGITSGDSLGSLASSIQAAVMPTPQQRIQHLKDELQKSQGQLADAKAYIDAYARELKRTRAEMRSMGHHINGLEQERQRLKKADQSREDELATVRRELENAKNLAKIRDKELLDLKRKEKEPGNQSRESDSLSIIRRELEDARNLASIRGKMLVGAEVFLTKADTVSVSEVVEKVNNLNEEIFQAAALLGEALIHKPHDISQEEMNSAVEIAQGMIGSKMIHIVREQSRKEVPEAHPLLVQVVLQISLVTYCSYLVQSWSNDRTCASHLQRIYSKMRDKEEQAVSGKWRSLARSYSRPPSDGWKQDLLRKLGCVLRTTSWMSPDVRHRDAFEQKLEPIFRAVEDLRNALGEKFTSADLEVSVMEGDQVFQPAYMDDAYGDPDSKPAGKNAPQEVVIGTTGIGLKKLMVQRSAKGELQYENVLSAKVALESTLLEALQPLPPKK